MDEFLVSGDGTTPNVTTNVGQLAQTTAQSEYNRRNVSKHVADAEWNEEARIVTLWVQIAVGTIGGLCACAWLWITRGEKKRVNVIFLHVTITDLLVMVATLIQVIWEMRNRWWLLGDATCRIVKFFQGFTMFASSNMLVLLSVDRHQAIRSPLSRKWRMWKLSLPFWLAAALLSLPMTHMFHVVTISDPESIFYNKTVCESRFRELPLFHRQAFLTGMSIVHVFGPCVVICFCYVRIFVRIAEHAAAPGLVPNDAAAGSAHLRRINSPMLSRAKIKTLRMTVVIVTTFVLCGLPYHVLEMLFNFWHHVNVPRLVTAILGALPVANSVINPYVFLLFTYNGSVFRKWRHNERSDHVNGAPMAMRARTDRDKSVDDGGGPGSDGCTTVLVGE